MEKKLIKLAAKHADKIDPTLMASLNKAGLKVPGGARPAYNPHSASCPAPSGPSYCPSTANQYASCPPQPNAAAAAYATATHSNCSPFAPIAPQYATTNPVELSLKEKSMSFTGDDAKIKDLAGNTVFKVHAELLTLSQRRSLVDAHCNMIGQLRHKKMDIKPTIYIGTPDNEKKAALITSGIFNPMKCDAKISVDGVTVGKVKGNWRAKKFSITINGVEVATIGRKRTVASTFMDADSYKISVRPQGQPVDLAFISLITIALDELYHEKE